MSHVFGSPQLHLHCPETLSLFKVSPAFTLPLLPDILLAPYLLVAMGDGLCLPPVTFVALIVSDHQVNEFSIASDMPRSGIRVPL